LAIGVGCEIERDKEDCRLFSRVLALMITTAKLYPALVVCQA
jgi:hypothetical protein